MLLACGNIGEALFWWLLPLWMLVVAGALGMGIVGLTLVSVSRPKSWRDAAGWLLSGTAVALGLIVVVGVVLSVVGSTLQDTASHLREIVSNPVLWSNLVGAAIGAFGISRSARKPRRTSRDL